MHRRAQFAALLWFEVRAQWREPLTTLYLLVFGLLSLGYVATDAVQLVSGRGDVPKTAPWALMLAFGGLTAFGQVITTMIATTAMLRDEATRTRSLIATSGVSAHVWFGARVLAAVLVMLMVYAAMPAGVLLGVTIGSAYGEGATTSVVPAALRAYAVITIPTMLIVTLLLSCAAALTQRVLGVLAAALALVGIWQLSLALVGGSAHVVSMPQHIGAVLDPFGNAPVLLMTASWSDAQRSVDPVPFSGVLLANRILWLFVASMCAAWVLTFRAAPMLQPAPVRDSSPRSGAAAYDRLAGVRSATASVRAFTALWMQRDGGWRVVSVLAAVNALSNGVSRPLAGTLPPAAEALLLISEHARVFLILLATVYAGELVWRERDVRVQQIMDALPLSRTARTWGGVSGLLWGQRAIIVPIAAGALAVALWRGRANGAADVIGWWAVWSVFVLWLPFAQLTVLSLTVHVLLDHKVGAHLLLITGWVLVTAAGGESSWPWYARFAEPAPLLLDGQLAWWSHAQRGAHWSAVSAALLMVCWWRWPMRATARAA